MCFLCNKHKVQALFWIDLDIVWSILGASNFGVQIKDLYAYFGKKIEILCYDKLSQQSKNFIIRH